jgi:glycine/D-amino acid oxidase-like deaminating enzyme
MAYHRHRLPVIGRLADGIWCAGGFGGMGLAATTMAGLPFAGGVFGRVPAQFVYWRDSLLRRSAAHRRL